MDEVLPAFEQLHSAIEEAWFHSAPLSEEEVYQRSCNSSSSHLRAICGDALSPAVL